MQEELTLLDRARRLDPEALSQIHETYYVPIYRYVAFRVSDHQTAEDLTSEVFVRLLNALRDRHAPQNTLRGWLYGVASRVVKEHYRQQKRVEQVSLSDSVPSLAAGPDQTVEAALTEEALQGVLTQLTDEQQNVLALRYGYEMPIRDVAKTMGKSEGSIKMLQARAVAALSKKMAEWSVR